MSSQEMSGANHEGLSASIFQILVALKPEVDFSLEEKFGGDQVLDSLDLIRLVGELDEVFGISINGSDIAPHNFESSAAIAALVRRYLSEVNSDD